LVTEPDELAIGLAVAETPPTPSARATLGLTTPNRIAAKYFTLLSECGKL